MFLLAVSFVCLASCLVPAVTLYSGTQSLLACAGLCPGGRCVCPCHLVLRVSEAHCAVNIDSIFYNLYKLV